MSVWFNLVPLVIKKQIHLHKQFSPDTLSLFRCFLLFCKTGRRYEFVSVNKEREPSHYFLGGQLPVLNCLR